MWNPDTKQVKGKVAQHPSRSWLKQTKARSGVCLLPAHECLTAIRGRAQLNAGALFDARLHRTWLCATGRIKLASARPE
jgi:hypothetical protein